MKGGFAVHRMWKELHVPAPPDLTAMLCILRVRETRPRRASLRAAPLASLRLSYPDHSTQRLHGSTIVTELFHSSPAVVAVRDDERVGGR